MTISLRYTDVVLAKPKGDGLKHIKPASTFNKYREMLATND